MKSEEACSTDSGRYIADDFPENDGSSEQYEFARRVEEVTEKNDAGLDCDIEDIRGHSGSSVHRKGLDVLSYPKLDDALSTSSVPLTNGIMSPGIVSPEEGDVESYRTRKLAAKKVGFRHHGRRIRKQQRKVHTKSKSSTQHKSKRRRTLLDRRNSHTFSCIQSTPKLHLTPDAAASEIIDLTSDVDEVPQVRVDLKVHGKHKLASRVQCRSSAGLLWKMCVKELENSDPDFFRSPEARPKIRTKARQGVAAYLGIGATKENCDGLRYVLEFYEASGSWASEILKTKSMKELSTAVSQFLRWCVASSSCKKYDLWKQECLFENIFKLHLVEQLMDYFTDCCEIPTFKRKAEALLCVCEAAVERECTSAPHLQLRQVFMLLKSFLGPRHKRISHGI